MTISYAVVGTSWITDSWVTSAASTQKWTLKAVYSRSAETASSFAAKHSISKTYNDLNTLAADQDIEAVYIASPNSLHFQHGKLILSAGKHVILEKPSCSTSNELAELIALAKSKKVFLIEAYRHIHECNFHVLKSAVGKLGPIYAASLVYATVSSRYSELLRGETPNIFSPDFSGGSLVDIGVYPISAAIALFGPPKKASYKALLLRTGVDGGGVILLEYDTFGVSINASKCYHSSAPCEVYGEKGTLRFNAVADIESVELLDSQTKATTQLAGEKVEKRLNLSEQAVVYADVIERQDWKRADELMEIGIQTLKVTEGLRRENGIVFGVERDPVEADR